jgi:hypothetical protein
MTEQSRPPAEPAEEPSPALGSLTVEDDPDGTEDPADLAGSAGPEDAEVGYQPSATEADDL